MFQWPACSICSFGTCSFGTFRFAGPCGTTAPGVGCSPLPKHTSHSCPFCLPVPRHCGHGVRFGVVLIELPPTRLLYSCPPQVGLNSPTEEIKIEGRFGGFQMLKIAPSVPKGQVFYRENQIAESRAARRCRQEIHRFPRLPQKIESHAELTELIRQGQGFVFNNRDDCKKLHRVTCESLEVMSTSKYEKLFFEDVDQATDWLDRNYGVHGWVDCGRCRYNKLPSQRVRAYLTSRNL